MDVRLLLLADDMHRLPSVTRYRLTYTGGGRLSSSSDLSLVAAKAVYWLTEAPHCTDCVWIRPGHTGDVAARVCHADTGEFIVERFGGDCDPDWLVEARQLLTRLS